MANEAMDNLNDALKNLADKTAGKVPPVTGAVDPVTPTEKPTKEFNEQSSEKPAKVKDPAKEKVTAIRSTALSNIAATLQQKRKDTITIGKRLLLQAMTKHAYIAGYITNFNEKVDFASKKEKAVEGGPTTFNIRLKMAPPSAIRAVIIMEPVVLLAMFENNRYDDVDSATKLQAICDKPFGDPSIAYAPYVCPWTEVTNYLLSKTNGRLNEHPDIVEDYIKKGTKSQAKTWNAKNDQSYLTASVKYVTDSKASALGDIKTPKVCTKHSYRSRIVTPINFVALKRYRTYKPGSTPTLPDKETAKSQITAYLNRFTKENKNNLVPMGNLSVDCSRNFTVSNGGKTIEGSTYFAVAGEASWYTNPANAIDHWYDKDAEGRAAQVKATDISLVVKTEKESSKGGKRIVTACDEIGSATSSSPYKFDEATYGTILKLTHNSLSVDKLNVKGTVVKGGKSVARVASEFKGDALAGLSADEITAILTSANKSARSSVG